MNQLGLDPVATGGASLELLYRGSSEAFVDALCTDALTHPAVEHPYLQRLAAGEVPDFPAALRDYCHQYSFYCREFPRYLTAVLANLELQEHRDLVQHNLAEEKGLAEEQGHGGSGANGASHCVPHTELYRRFCHAAGATAEYAVKTPACRTVLIWRDLFLQKCGSPEPGVGLGAIGLGTEMLVSSFYRYLHRAVSEHSDLTEDDYAFLTVHLDCDDEHGDHMKRISIDLAEDPGQREALRFGVLSSLNLRNAFWDVMLARAVTQ